jgi:hypothetical protein
MNIRSAILQEKEQLENEGSILGSRAVVFIMYILLGCRLAVYFAMHDTFSKNFLE